MRKAHAYINESSWLEALQSANQHQRYRMLDEAFAEIIYARAKSILKNSADAEEASRTTLWIATEQFKTFRNHCPLHCWIFSINKSICLRIVKKNKLLHQKNERLFFENQNNRNNMQEFPIIDNKSEEKSILEIALSKIPNWARQIIIASCQENVSYMSISNALNISIGTVKSRLNRAKKIVSYELLKQLFSGLDLYSIDEHPLYRIYRSSSTAIAAIDGNGYYLTQNRPHQDILEYSIEQLRENTPEIHMGQVPFEKVRVKLLRKLIYKGAIRSTSRSGLQHNILLTVLPVIGLMDNVNCYIGIKEKMAQTISDSDADDSANDAEENTKERPAEDSFSEQAYQWVRTIVRSDPRLRNQTILSDSFHNCIDSTGFTELNKHSLVNINPSSMHALLEVSISNSTVSF